MSEVNAEVGRALPRDDMIRTAVSFLSNPNVKTSHISQREAFLRSKGLTEEEIRLAFERSMAPPPSLPPYHLSTPLYTPFQKLKDILYGIALFIASSYGLFYFYKKVISVLLFGKPKKPEIESVAKSVSELRQEVAKVHADLEQVVVTQTESQQLIRNIGDLKSELATVKGILLSRQQFPAVNLTGTSSIPAWQMAACPENGDRSSEVETHPNSNGGSQGSDSSLEMIKEVEVAESEAVL